MKTISMIGLINNVYNEFHIPERIKIDYGSYKETFKWDKNEKWFVTLDDSTLLRIDQNKLNMEVEILEDKKVEILEENKKIEKLPYYSLEKIQKAKNREENIEKRIQLLEIRIDDYHNKINEIIDKMED